LNVEQILETELLSFTDKRLRHDTELNDSARNRRQPRGIVSGGNNFDVLFRIETFALQCQAKPQI
jgi:hypothetical protein